MKRYGILTLLAATILTLAPAVSVRADISNAAVLYLRIAPGARAAGMGEAYVAITDDATATHWNPAGLGAYPLADSWIEAGIPKRFRPIKAVAALKHGSAGDYTAYELWALTPEGLVRYDNKEWHLSEQFGTKTDQTIEKLLGSYFNVSDEERLQDMVQRVAEANNKRDYAYLEQLAADIRAAIPSSYSAREMLESLLDTMLVGYNQCRLNWDRVDDAQAYLRDGMKDSVLTEIEADRISVAVEKSRSRFIHEEIEVPYAVGYSGEPTSMAALDNNLLLGTTAGLVVYNGTRWHTITMEDGLPSDTVLSIYSLSRKDLRYPGAAPTRAGRVYESDQYQG